MDCETCGRDLVQTHPATRYEPAEWECPCCDGGLDEHDADGWDEYDEELASERAG